MSAERLTIGQMKEKEPLQDHCGIIGAYGKTDFRFLPIGINGLRKLQTRGHDGAGGIGITSTHEVVFNKKGEGKVKKVFPTEFIENNKGTTAKLWVFQTRYGTNGDGEEPELSLQPIIREHKTGDLITISHNGEFASEDRNGPVSDTVLFAERLAESNGSNWSERIVTSLTHEAGAFSLIIGTPDGMFLARDPRGIRPLSYGKYWDELAGSTIWVAASETNALSHMGVGKFTEVLPGHVVKIDDEGPRVIHQFDSKTRELCLFENVYVGHGNSKAHVPRELATDINDTDTIGEHRFRSGKIMAREMPLSSDKVDFVIGIPGTAISGGKGFAEGCGLPYLQAISDVDPDENNRTFMIADINQIYGQVLEGLTFNRDQLKGKRIGLVDDSIVRSNVMRAVVGFLRDECGVASIHVRVLCPPIENVCNRGLNTRTQDELIAGRILLEFPHLSNEQLVEEIRQRIKVDSLAYLSLDGLREAQTENPHDERFCTQCMNQSPAPYQSHQHNRTPTQMTMLFKKSNDIRIADPVTKH